MIETPTNCPFCDIINKVNSSRIIDQNDYAIVIRDGFPISLGHTLIIPKQHIASLFDVTNDVRQSMLNLLESAKQMLDIEYKPDAYNIGINDGKEAGQTVPHLHIHLIPRYKGDVEDPKGGIRWVKPDKAVYWSDD